MCVVLCAHYRLVPVSVSLPSSVVSAMLHSLIPRSSQMFGNGTVLVQYII